MPKCSLIHLKFTPMCYAHKEVNKPSRPACAQLLLFCFLCWNLQSWPYETFPRVVFVGMVLTENLNQFCIVADFGSQCVVCKCLSGIRFLKELCTQYMEAVLLFIFCKAHIQCNALVSKEQNLLKSLHCKCCLTCLVSLRLSLNFPTWPHADWANNGNIFVFPDSCTEQSNRSWLFGPNTNWAIQVLFVARSLASDQFGRTARFIFAVDPLCPFPCG